MTIDDTVSIMSSMPDRSSQYILSSCKLSINACFCDCEIFILLAAGVPSGVVISGSLLAADFRFFDCWWSIEIVCIFALCLKDKLCDVAVYRVVICDSGRLPMLKVG